MVCSDDLALSALLEPVVKMHDVADGREKLSRCEWRFYRGCEAASLAPGTSERRRIDAQVSLDISKDAPASALVLSS